MAKKNLTLLQALDGLAMHLAGMNEFQRDVTARLLPVLTKDPEFSEQMAAMLEALMSSKVAKPAPAKIYELKPHQ